MNWARAANLTSKQQPDIFVETLREKAKSMESPTEVALRLIKAQHLWDAAELCNKVKQEYMDHCKKWGTPYAIACQDCERAIQLAARSLDPFVGDEEGRKRALTE